MLPYILTKENVLAPFLKKQHMLFLHNLTAYSKETLGRFELHDLVEKVVSRPNFILELCVINLLIS